MAKKKNKKASDILLEIQKQSEEQRNQIINEITEAKKVAVSKAEIQFEQEAEKYIAQQMSKAEAEIKGEYAVKTLKSQGELFKLRDDMTKKVFDKAKEKLTAFSSTTEYESFLEKFAKEIADVFENKGCTIYLRPCDIKFAEKINEVFNGNAEIKVDNQILVGGIKGYCPELNIIADNTLDSKLEEQKLNFVKNADLKIV